MNITAVENSEQAEASEKEALTHPSPSLWIRLINRTITDRQRPADFFAVLLAAAIPWSTTATAILAVLWFIALVPTLDRTDLIRNIRAPAGALPLLLAALAVASVTWSNGNSSDIIRGLKPFLRLLLIPLLLTQFSHSDRGIQVLKGFLASCSLLLAFSFATTIHPALYRADNPGVPIRDQTAQSAEFVLCAFALLYFAIRTLQKQNFALGAALAICSLLFLLDVIFIATSRTELVILPALVAMLSFRLFGPKSLPIALLTICVLAAVIWSSSSYIRGRIGHGVWEVQQFEQFDRPTSIGLRLTWWKESIDFIRRAPILGHGAGSIENLFKAATEGKNGASGTAINNPHNQFLAVAIPLGFLGLAMVITMWWYHFVLFRGDGWLRWLGTMVIIRTIVGSLFYSQLLDFTEAWIYVWAVGVIGGTLIGKTRANGRKQTARQGTAVRAEGSQAGGPQK